MSAHSLGMFLAAPWCWNWHRALCWVLVLIVSGHASCRSAKPISDGLQEMQQSGMCHWADAAFLKSLCAKLWCISDLQGENGILVTNTDHCSDTTLLLSSQFSLEWKLRTSILNLLHTNVTMPAFHCSTPWETRGKRGCE